MTTSTRSSRTRRDVFPYLLWAVLLIIVSIAAPYLESPTRSHPVLLTAAILMSTAGFVVGWSGALALTLREGHEPTQAELTRLENSFGWWNRSSFAVGRWSRVVFWDFTLGELKAAWRSGRWLREPHWRRISMMVGGALAFLFGFLSAFFLLGGGPMTVFWFVFMAIYVAWYFARA
jgi:hypothetical protein